MTSIHDKGAKAVDAFRALPWPTGTQTTPGPRAGRSSKTIPDCLVRFLDGLEVAVEVKKSTTSAAQMRALAYKVTVVWIEGRGWWVIPPQDIMEMATRYAAQHCTNAFECMNPGKPNDTWT